MKPLKRPARRALLVVHVAVSVSWLGLTLGLLTLGVTAYTTGDSTLTDASYRAMDVFADRLLAPIVVVTLVSGLVLSLGTPWGLARHHWVWIKFWITLVTGAATVFALRPGIGRAADSGGVPDISLVAAPTVATSAYLFMTVISVLKPWGLTRRGRRHRDAVRATRTGGTGPGKRLSPAA
ncbi:DUF2269 domain-containing protein [Streptomyces camponoticapitis]|uniref:DUF2269 domain-containing protein n=1 Tax=Streptomyces camponoticapitis TaxID=1616125 RepID=UPI00166CF059|nr:DUF2269 domain-containing protein [Streptomyces camponoticapitis]